MTVRQPSMPRSREINMSRAVRPYNPRTRSAAVAGGTAMMISRTQVT